MAKYIEVIGRGDYYKTAKEYKLKFELYTSRLETKVDRYKMRKVLEKVVEAVTENGFPQDKILYGGTDSQTWYWKRRNSESTETALLFVHDDEDLLSRMQVWFDEVPYEGFKYRVESLPPVFEVSEEGAEKQAYANAIENARNIAEGIALAGGVELGDLIQAQEVGLAKRGSGYQGDYDWGDAYGVSSAAAVAVGVLGEGQPQPQVMELGKPKQTITVKLRVRFGIR